MLHRFNRGFTGGTGKFLTAEETSLCRSAYRDGAGPGFRSTRDKVGPAKYLRCKGPEFQLVKKLYKFLTVGGLNDEILLTEFYRYIGIDCCKGPRKFNLSPVVFN